MYQTEINYCNGLETKCSNCRTARGDWFIFVHLKWRNKCKKNAFFASQIKNGHTWFETSVEIHRHINIWFHLTSAFKCYLRWIQCKWFNFTPTKIQIPNIWRAAVIKAQARGLLTKYDSLCWYSPQNKTPRRPYI